MRLETGRLILRPIEVSDAPAIFPLINDADVARYLLSVPHPYPEAELVPWIRKARESMARRERWELTIVLRETDLPIGVCSLADISWEHANAELGYWLGKKHWGRGYMTEAVRRLARFGFDDLRMERIHARVLSPNTRSIKVIENSGLKLEYLARHEVLRNGEFLDMLHYGLIREEYSR
jgi:ribosomal-protein-alanine N-acetyltransferase